MTENGGSSYPFPAATGFDINRNMSDSQLRHTLTQISTAANAAYASPTPQPAHAKSMSPFYLFILLQLKTLMFLDYLKNLQNWSTSTTPPPKNPALGTRSTRARTTRSSALAAAPTTYQQPVYQAPVPIIPALPSVPPNPPRPPLPTTSQALQSTYSSRLKTGVSLLVQPILATASGSNTRAATRRGGAINYADPGSGDDIPDAGAIDTDDSDFIASGGTRTSIRQSRSRMNPGINVFNAATGVSSPRPVATPRPEKAELDQSYLGMVPPARFIKPRMVAPTPHEYPYVFIGENI